MAPTTVLGVILFLAVLLPGFAWLWESEKRGPMVVRPPTVAIAELAVVGTFSAALAFGFVVFLGIWCAWFVDISVWLTAKDPTAYLGTHFWQAWASLLLQLLVGGALAFVAAVLLRRSRRTVFNPGSTVLHQVLDASGPRRLPAPRKQERNRARRCCFFRLWMAQSSKATCAVFRPTGTSRTWPSNRRFLSVEKAVRKSCRIERPIASL